MARKHKVRRSRLNRNKYGAFQQAEFNPFEEKKIVNHMKSIYNKNHNDRRFQTFKERDYADNFLQYEIMANILGNTNYIKLKESRHLDSDQVIDAVRQFTFHATEKQIESALLKIFTKVNNVEKEKQKALDEALAAGFSMEEAMEYSELVAEDLGGLHPELGYQELIDQLTELVGKNQKRENIRNRLKKKRRR